MPKKPWSVRLSKGLIAQIEKQKEIERRSGTEIVSRAIVEYLARYRAERAIDGSRGKK